jgi:hypothetical protein
MNGIKAFLSLGYLFPKLDLYQECVNLARSPRKIVENRANIN